MPAPDSKLIAAALGQPWAISEDGMRRVVDALQSRDGKPLQNARKATFANGVAVIPVDGPLSKKSSWIQEFFGGSSYESIAKDFVVALDDSSVTAIVFDVDSPGGEVSGVGELSSLIYAARGKKKIVAYASGAMCSAAYWLASSADEIVCDPSAMLGSIGVRSVLVDASKAYDAMGIKPFDIVSSQSPYKVVDAANADDRARVQESLTAMAAVFIDDVARGRKASAATVLAQYGKGDVLIGKHAVSAGLADRLGDMESLLASLSFGTAGQNVSASTKGKKTMADASMKNGKCSDCRKAVGDEDDMYCGKCAKSKASASVLDAQIFALTGKTDAIEAIGVLTAWKNTAGEMVAIREQAAKDKQAAADLAFDAEIATAKNMRLLAVSDDHKRNKAALAFKAQPEAIKGLKSFLSALDPLSAPSAEESAKPVVAAQVGPDGKPVAAPVPHGFDDKTVKAFGEIQKKTGSKYTVEQLAAHKAELAKTLNPSEEK